MANQGRSALPGGPVQRWLLPLSYLIHLGEEYFGGEGFPVWFSRVFDTTLTTSRFLTINRIGLLVVTAGAIAARSGRIAPWYLAIGGTIFGLNALAHLAGTLWLGRYSPGVVSGVLVWFPLAWWSLRWAKAGMPRGQLAVAMAIGILLHLAVTLAASSG